MNTRPFPSARVVAHPGGCAPWAIEHFPRTDYTLWNRNSCSSGQVHSIFSISYWSNFLVVLARVPWFNRSMVIIGTTFVRRQRRRCAQNVFLSFRFSSFTIVFSLSAIHLIHVVVNLNRKMPVERVMDDDLLVCGVCKMQFDGDERKPKFLPCNHHTLCFKCLNGVIRHPLFFTTLLSCIIVIIDVDIIQIVATTGTIKCPVCHQVHDVRAIPLSDNSYIQYILKLKSKIESNAISPSRAANQL